jgi:MSHA biogenesis protein MshM
MFLQHFRLREAPFGLTPDTSFAFGSRSHCEALDTLTVALDEGDGFIKITGEVGTGKTLLCRRLLKALDERYRTVFMPNPCTHRRALLISLGLELGLAFEMNTPQAQLMPMLAAALLANAEEGRTVVVCLDEAQAMSDEALETLRLLTNIETEKKRLLRVVMFGQPELDVKLAQPHMRQLAQRISFHYRLSALTRDESQAYLNHRMAAAGYTGAPVFGPREARLIHRLTGGVPRLLNVVAHKALLLAFGQADDRVRLAHVRAAAGDTPALPLRGVRQWLATQSWRVNVPLTVRWGES